MKFLMVFLINLLIIVPKAEAASICEQWGLDVQDYAQMLRQVQDYDAPTGVMFSLPAQSYPYVQYRKTETPDSRDRGYYVGPKDESGRRMNCGPWLREDGTQPQSTDGTIEGLTLAIWWKIFHQTYANPERYVEPRAVERDVTDLLRYGYMYWGSGGWKPMTEAIKRIAVNPDAIEQITNALISFPLRHERVTKVAATWATLVWDASMPEVLKDTGAAIRSDKDFAKINQLKGVMYRRELDSPGVNTRYRVAMARLATAYALPTAPAWVYAARKELSTSRLSDKSKLLAQLPPELTQ